VFFGPRLYRWATLVYLAHECRVFQASPSDVVWDIRHGWHRPATSPGEPPTPVPTPYPAAWDELHSRLGYPSARHHGTVFLGTMTSPAGHKRFVAIEFLDEGDFDYIDVQEIAENSRSPAELEHYPFDIAAYIVNTDSLGFPSRGGPDPKASMVIGFNSGDDSDDDVYSNWMLFEGSAEFGFGTVDTLGRAVIPFSIDGRNLSLVAELQDDDWIYVTTNDSEALREIGRKRWPTGPDQWPWSDAKPEPREKPPADRLWEELAATQPSGPTTQP